MKKRVFSYEDILFAERPVLSEHPPMPVSERAAQFAPFAALTGHGDAVKETARLTDAKMELDETYMDDLNTGLKELLSRGETEIFITYFLPDTKKDGGSYETACGSIKKIDDFDKTLILESGERIPLQNILQIETE